MKKLILYLMILFSFSTQTIKLPNSKTLEVQLQRAIKYLENEDKQEGCYHEGSYFPSETLTDKFINQLADQDLTAKEIFIICKKYCNEAMTQPYTPLSTKVSFTKTIITTLILEYASREELVAILGPQWSYKIYEF